MFRTMFYPKNVPNWERIIRILAGIAVVVLAFSGAPLLGQFGAVGQVIAIISAVVIVFTGFFGWCPMCALVGRKINKSKAA